MESSGTPNGQIPLILIHGAWLSARSWENYADYTPTEFTYAFVNTFSEEDAAAAYERYKRAPAKTDYLEFEGRPHFHMVASDRQEVAAAIDSWLDGVLDAAVAATEQAV